MVYPVCIYIFFRYTLLNTFVTREHMVLVPLQLAVLYSLRPPVTPPSPLSLPLISYSIVFALDFFVFFYSYHFLPYFSEELNELNKKLKLPRTVIAVVGDTGAGKSSLLNALLDHGNILPTSGMRACTAVVVEVQQNLRTNCYEADIDFLSLEVSNSVEK